MCGRCSVADRDPLRAVRGGCRGTEDASLLPVRQHGGRGERDGDAQSAGTHQHQQGREKVRRRQSATTNVDRN